ncbi:FAD-linked oxidase [Streptomyces griseocarneus]|nr:FAD-linked oxidase [Streptomyces griseocarneus]
MLLRGQNRLYVGKPDNVVLPTNTNHVVRAVNAAQAAGQRIAVRSGGHGLAGLADDPAIQTVIDLSEFNAVSFNTIFNAFEVEAGALLGDVYKTLDLGWGVTIPGGSCPTVGVGGHITGGGYGYLSRQYGLVADNVCAVEVVVVGRNGMASSVIATNGQFDPNRDLWWACCGGGGGNFGIVTRYWLRSPGATGTDPTLQLPPSPTGLTTTTATWRWSDLDAASWATLVGNFTAWTARNSAPGTPTAPLMGLLVGFSHAIGSVTLTGVLDPSKPGSRPLLDAFVKQVIAGVPAPAITTQENQAWLYHTINLPPLSSAFGIPSDQIRTVTKGAYLRQPLTAAQAKTAYNHLNDTTYTNPAVFFISTYGGQINALPADANASSHRDSMALMAISNYWADPATDADNRKYIRTFYQELFATTGGVPTPGGQTDGSYINWPDADLLDPAWNSSGVPWSTIYYKNNYQRLRQIKSAWDPTNAFRHTLSVEPA